MSTLKAAWDVRGLPAWPRAARAQHAGKVMRVGFFGPGLTASSTIAPYQAFLAQLRELGLSEGQNIVVEYRNVDDSRGPFVAAADLMRLRPDLIVAAGPEVALQAVVGASLAVPIVMIAINYDPIARGYVTSLARPGGNITGVVSQQLKLAQKQVELLTQAFPDRTRLAILFDVLSADQFTASPRTPQIQANNAMIPS
jgi:putative ABC transport system substrate-binding protein